MYISVPMGFKPRYEASDALCKELRKTGIKSLHEVDRGVLAKELPSKWDLADPLPQGKNGTFIKDMLLRAHEKGVGLNALISHLKTHSLNIDIGIASQALTQIEEKIGPALEQKFGAKNWEIKSAILAETLRLLKSPNQVKGGPKGIDFNRATKEIIGDIGMER